MIPRKDIISAPTISVVIPTYNRARYLPEAIASALAQSRPVDEIIVVDDGSTDETETLMRAYGKPVRYIRQKNGGPGSARNHGFREAQGDFIALLDSDDLWTKDKIERQVAFLTENPEVDFLFADMTIFPAKGGQEAAEIKVASIHEYFVTHAPRLEDFFECLVVENMVPTSSVLLRRRCLNEVGFFDETLKIAEDLDLWLRVARKCHCAFIHEVLVRRRRHDDNLINNWARVNQYHAQVLERALNMQPAVSARAQTLLKEKLAALYYDLGSYYFSKKKFSQSYAYLSQGAPRRRFDWKRGLKVLVLSPFFRRASAPPLAT